MAYTLPSNVKLERTNCHFKSWETIQEEIAKAEANGGGIVCIPAGSYTIQEDNGLQKLLKINKEQNNGRD